MEHQVSNQCVRGCTFHGTAHRSDRSVIYPGAVVRAESKRRALAPLLGRRTLIIALLLGVVLRVGAMLVISPSGVELNEFGTIGTNLTTDRGYTYYAEQPDGSVI